MDIFSEKPRSFKMDRKSPLAIDLKASVTQKLLEFIGNYTDDVLAEYIVVLVCNGKHQNQARDDLEAFLAERSGEFVSWLWDVLLKTVDQYHTPIGSAELKDVIVTSGCDDLYNEQRICRMGDLRSQAIGNADNLLDGQQLFQSSCAAKPISSTDVEVSEGFQHCCPGFDSSLGEINTKEVWSQKGKHEVPKKSGSTEDNLNGVLKYGSSGISAGGEQSVQFVDLHKKIAYNKCNGLRHQLQYSPNRELASRNLQSVIAENPHSKLFSAASGARTHPYSRSCDSVSHQNSRPRGNVWDRLGKPCDDNTIARGQKIAVQDLDVIKRNIVENDRKEPDQSGLLPFVPDSRLNRRSVGRVPVLDNNCGIVPSNTKPGEYKRLEHGLNALCSPHDANNPNRKRPFAEIVHGPGNGSVSLGDSEHMHLHDKETYKEFQRPSSVKCSRSQSSISVASETRKPGGPGRYHGFISPDTTLHLRANKLSQTKLMNKTSEAATTQTLVSNCSPLGTKSESTNSEKDVNTIIKPVQAQMLDVKLRLRQIETEMYKLRSKQVEMSNDGKLNSSSSLGTLNHSGEDISLRTVFVTNVHFAATKEALSLHFSKCGVVVKVFMVNDKVTAQPKGSAYITFASKEATDKAVALNGTSFLSRTLKVTRKAEMSAVTKVPLQLGEKVSQSPQPNRKVVLGRPFTSSHLQWRRDQLVNGGHCGSSAGSGIDASKAVEQDGVNSGS